MPYYKIESSETFQTETDSSEEKENINNSFVSIDNESEFIFVGEDLSLENDVKSTTFEVKINDVIKNWKDYVVKINPDGNCLFRSLSYCLCKKENNFNFIRKVVVCHVMKKWQFYMDFVVGNEELNDVKSKEDYAKYMSKTGTFGGHVELVAASRVFVININIFTDTGSTFITNVRDKVKPTFSLFYEGDGYQGHYNVIAIDINQEQWERQFKYIEHISANGNDEIPCENCGEVFWENGCLVRKCHHELQFKLPDLTPYLSELEKLFLDENLTESNYYRKSSVSTLQSFLKKALLASGVDIINIENLKIPFCLPLEEAVCKPKDSEKYEE